MLERQKIVVPLAPANSPILRQVAEKYDFNNPEHENATELAFKLADTMIARGGVGLAAPQIGIPLRVFVIKANPIIACFNPRIVDASEEMEDGPEGCLTYPGLQVTVPRSKAIKVRYTQPNGNVVTTKYIGMTARIFQHELDHLDGKLIVHFLNSRLNKEMIIKKAKKAGITYRMADFI